MRVKISSTAGDLVIDDGIRGLMLESPLEGFGMPPIRTSNGNLSGVDGGYVSGQFFSQREMVINGNAGEFDYTDYVNIRNGLINKLSIRENLNVTVTIDNGDEYSTEAYLADFKMDITPRNSGRFQITLVAPDPYFFMTNEYNQDGWVIEQINKSVSGGYETPYILPVTWSTGTTPAIISNPTKNLILPVLEFNDSWTNPKVTNIATGSFVKVNASMTTGDNLIIDIQRRTVVLNGGSILASLDAGSNWWGLISGNNTITLESDSGGDETVAELRYRIPYVGVFGGS